MKFLAFYRILPKQPAPVVPIFTHEKKSYRQIAGENDVVSEYRETPDLVKERLFIANEIKVPTPNIGEKCIYAYEYAKNSIALGDIEGIKNRLLSIATKDINAKENCFAVLEIAAFIGNESLIKSTADQCYKSLSMFSSDLSDKWLDGASLDEATKEYIRRENAKIITSEKIIPFQFSCRKAVSHIIFRNAVDRNISTNEYINRCIGTVLGDKDFYDVFSSMDISKTYDILLSPKSKILSGHMVATANIIVEVRNILRKSKSVGSNRILESFVIEDSQEDSFTKIETFRSAINRNFEKEANKISKRERVSKSEAKGLILSAILDKADPEFISKVHGIIKLKSDKLSKNIKNKAQRYYKKYINYIPDI